VRVRPGAARTAVGGRRGDALVVCVTARPALLALFDVAELKKYMTSEELAGLPGAAEIYGVPGRDVTLVTGATSRDKVIEVAGPPAPLARRLGELLGP
jgi:uncharacterized protein YggU (UPF0235/DUF167 family)